MTFGTFAVIWGLAIAVGFGIGNRKGRRGTGFLLGLVLGWVGVILIACIPPSHDMKVLRETERLRIQREAAGQMSQSP